MRILLIGGTFNDEGGKPSGIVKKIANYLSNTTTTYINGGAWSVLEALTVNHNDVYDVIIWMANVPNDKPKLVQKIKEFNPRVLLVTSKRNTKEKYSLAELTKRALVNKVI